MKIQTTKPAAPKALRNKANTTPASQLNRQARKVMGQHYRAKYGVGGK